jgi:iron complex outermembrane receptor protein
MHPPHSLNRVTFVLCLGVSTCLLPVSALRAQTAGAPPDDEVVRLSEFRVSTTLGSYTDLVSEAASKTPIAMHDLSSTVQVVNASFMTDIRAERLDDVYSYVVGMYRENANQANGYTIRGFTGTSSNLNGVQVDGVPGLTSRFSSPPTAAVERVEFIKGPSSALYGQGNPGGIVNIITKSPQVVRSESVTAYVSTYDSSAVHNTHFGNKVSAIGTIDLTGPIDAAGHLLYRVIVAAENINTFRDYYYEHNVYWYPSLTYRWNDRTEITAKLEVTRQLHQANDGLVVPYNSPDLLPPINVTQTQPGDTEADSGDALSIYFKHAFSEQWKFRLNARTDWHTDKRLALEDILGTVVSAVPYTNSTVTRKFRVQHNGRRYNELDTNLTGLLGPDSFRHTIIGGFEFGREWNDLSRLAFGPVVPPPVNIFVSVPNVPATYPTTATGLSDPKTLFDNYDTYLSDQIKLGEKWRVALGVQHFSQSQSYVEPLSRKTYSQTNSATVPHFGLVFQPVPSVSLYADYSRSFRPQSATAVNANDLPGFTPESGRQFEEGVKLDLLNHNLIVTLSNYEIVRNNVVESTGVLYPVTGDTISALSGEQKSKGGEVQVDYHPVPYWQLQVGYSYIDARVIQSLTVSEDGRLLANVPHNGGSLWTRYNFLQRGLLGAGVGLGEIYVGKRLAYGANVVTATQSLWMVERSYARTDLALYYRWKRADLSLNVQNVFDKQYLENAFYNSSVVAGDPRKLTLTGTLKF